MNGLTEYFDLASEWKKKLGGQSKQIPSWLLTSGIQYLALVLGVTIQPYFAAYQTTGIWDFRGLLGRVLFAAITALAIFPAVYKNAFDPSKPFIGQFGAIFTAGMGWQSLLSTAITAVSGPPQ